MDLQQNGKQNVPDYNKKIEKIEMKSNGDSNEIEDKETFLKKIFGPDLHLNEVGLTFSDKVRRILNSNYFHISVVILVLLDTICVASELIVTIENKEDNNALSNLLQFLKYFGIVILGCFLVEIPIKLAFNTHEFIRSKLEIFDSIIVIVSFVLDIVFFHHHASAAFELMTLLRLWRIARIVNGRLN